MELRFDLLDENPERRYTLYLKSSTDGFIQPLQNVEGAIGPDIAVGNNKTIIWHAREELGAFYSGDISLRIEGSIYVPFIVLDGFEQYQSLRRGTPVPLVWSGGRGNNIMNIELFKGDDRVAVVHEDVANDGNHNLILPASVKPGKGYHLRIVDQRNNDDVVNTQKFDVKRKLPLGMTAGGGTMIGAGIGALVYYLLSGIKDPPGPGG
ncbi:MAG: hypothetical protein OEW75_10140 [Cyclobacteriaceae bacterium]|nr:hypothetical protein [Cyclobacteriaceae bacterium]